MNRNKPFDLERVQNIIDSLLLFLESKEGKLKKMNKEITEDTDYWINHDYRFTKKYLKSYIENHKKFFNERNPKGSVGIFLSYNEPLVLSVIPIFNALVTGNKLSVRPSSRSQEFLSKIWVWSGLKEQYELPLQIVDWEKGSTANHLQKLNTLLFFGSYKTSINISKECGDSNTEFLPEVEGADVKVISNQDNNFNMRQDALETLRGAFSHAGQSCQRIHGIYVSKEIYSEYKSRLISVAKERLDINKHVSPAMSFEESSVANYTDLVDESNANDSLSLDQIPFSNLMFNPDSDSSLVQQAPFLPTLWILSYGSKEELIDLLNSRKFSLGLNINGSDLFAREIINKTFYSRYTVNTSHVKIRSDEGWGGNWPTGYRGYRMWPEYFTNPYKTITN